METIEMLNALDMAVDRKATILAARNETTPPMEAYWRIKFKQYRWAIENIIARFPDDKRLAEEIRTELQHVREG